MSPKLTLLTALGFQWRAMVADAIYSQGIAVVPGTARKGSRRKRCTSKSAIRSALGARNADYVGVEAQFGW
ncbi:alginate export family protein [Caballeronia sp. SEWSISQ10-4 2]|nr:hypothetical protein [Caballeronia sp. SEWSISQ10-4 2]MDN7179717.1 alginate export family protein [Caballeronia sp. SEWSISQ10-4 2]